MAMKTIRTAAVGSVSALALAAAGSAGAVSFEAGDTDVSIYGYAIGKISYDFDEQLGDATAASFDNIADDGAEPGEGHVDLDATQSRLGFTTETGELRTTFEGDMRGAGGGEFRLRHAFGEYMGFLAGQTWSNFNSFVGSTPSIDFDGVAGQAGFQARRAQFRYTTGDFSVSVEDPGPTLGDVGGGSAALADAQKSALPRFTARYESEAGPLGYSFGAMAQELAYDDGDDDDSTMGYGVFAAASYELGAATVRGALNYSDGNNSDLYLSPGVDGYVDADGDVEPIEGYGGTLGVSVPGGMGTINAAVGWVELDPDDDFTAANGDVDETRWNALVNYLWNPIESITYGVELSYWERESMAGADGDGVRISAAAQYSF